MFSRAQLPYAVAAAVLTALQPVLVTLSKNLLGAFDYSVPASTPLAEILKLCIEDSDFAVRDEALQTLGKHEPVKLAQHADAVVARLQYSGMFVRAEALKTLGKLEPAVLAQHAGAVVLCLDDDPVGDWVVPQRDESHVPGEALTTLQALPLVVTREIDFQKLQPTPTICAGGYWLA